MTCRPGGPAPLSGGSRWRLHRVGDRDIESRAHLMSVLAEIRRTPRSEQKYITTLAFLRIVPRALHFDEFISAVRTVRPGAVMRCLSPRALRPAPCTIVTTSENENKVSVRFDATGHTRELDRAHVLIEGDWAPHVDWQVAETTLAFDGSQRLADLPQQRVQLGDDVCFGKSNWLRPERGRVVRWASDERWDVEVVITPCDRRDAPWTELRRNIGEKQLVDVIGERDLAVAAPTCDWRRGVVRSVKTRPAELVIRGPWRVRSEYSKDDAVRISKGDSPYHVCQSEKQHRLARPGIAPALYVFRTQDPDARWPDGQQQSAQTCIGDMASAHPRYRAPELLEGKPPSNDAKGWAARKPATNKERERAKKANDPSMPLGLHLAFNEVRAGRRGHGAVASSRRRWRALRERVLLAIASWRHRTRPLPPTELLFLSCVFCVPQGDPREGTKAHFGPIQARVRRPRRTPRASSPTPRRSGAT